MVMAKLPIEDNNTTTLQFFTAKLKGNAHN